MDPASAEDVLARLRSAGFHCTALELVQELRETADVPGMQEVLASCTQWLRDVMEEGTFAPLFDQCVAARWARHQTASVLQHALNAERATTTALRAHLAEAVHAVPACEGGGATPLETLRLDALVLQYLRDRGLRLTAVTMCEEMDDTPTFLTNDAPLVTLLRQTAALTPPSPPSPSPPPQSRPPTRPTLHARTLHHCSIAPSCSGQTSTSATTESGPTEAAALALASQVARCLVPVVKTVVTARRLELLPLLHVLLTSCPPEGVQALLDTLPTLVRHPDPATLAPLSAMVLAVADHRGLDWTLQHLVPWVLAAGQDNARGRGAASRAAVQLGVACSVLAAASPTHGGALGALPLQHVQALGRLLEGSVDDAVSPACVTWALGVVACAWAAADAKGDHGQANRLLLAAVHDVSQAMVLAGAQQQQDSNDSGDDGDGDAAWSTALWNDVVPHVRTWAASQGMVWRMVANSWLAVWQEAMSGLAKDRSSDSGEASSAAHGAGAGVGPDTPAAEKQWLVAAQWFQHSWADVAAAVKAPITGDVQLGACRTWRAPTPCSCVRTGMDAVLAQAVWVTDAQACAPPPCAAVAAAVDAWEGVRWLCLQALPTFVQAAHCAGGREALLRSVVAVVTTLCGAMGPAFTVHVVTPVLQGAACLPRTLLSECCLQVQRPPAEFPHARTALGLLVGPECDTDGEPLSQGVPTGGRVPTGALVVCVLGVWHGSKCMDGGTRRAVQRSVCKLPEVAAAVARAVAPVMTTAQLGEWLEVMTTSRATAPLCVAVCRARAALNPATLESCVLPQVLQVLAAGSVADPKLRQAACMAAGKLLASISPGGQAALLEGLHASWLRGPTHAVEAVTDGMQFATQQPGAKDVAGGLLAECQHIVDGIAAAAKAGNQAMGTISHHISCTCPMCIYPCDGWQAGPCHCGFVWWGVLRRGHGQWHDGRRQERLGVDTPGSL